MDMTETSTPEVNVAENFCPKCGRSCVPLEVPHLSRACGECGRTVHFVRHAVEGGIAVGAGERLSIPAGFITFSLDPASRGKLFRPGLKFLLDQMFLGDHPKGPEDIVEFARALDKASDEYLARCEKLSGLDLSLEADTAKAMKALEEDKGSRDWHMLMQGLFSAALIESVNSSDCGRAAWAGYMLGSVRGLTIVTEPIFEQTLWRGYLAGQVVYEAAVAASSTPAEAEAIRKLQPLFQKVDEATLHAWVESGLPIGPRIGIKSLPESLIAALAKFQLTTIQRERDDARLAVLDRREDARLEAVNKLEGNKLRATWLTIGIAAATALGTALKAVGWL
jgi:ribosomal protein S27AE